MKKTIILEEPELIFGNNQRMIDPRDGLSLYGPTDLGSPTHPESINYILIGTVEGINKFNEFSIKLNRSVYSTDQKDHRLWVPFIGFEEAYQSKLNQPIKKYYLDKRTLEHESRQFDEYVRSNNVVLQYLDKIKLTQKLDEQIGVAICIVPDIVNDNCRPESKVYDKVGEKISGKMKKAAKDRQFDLLTKTNFSVYDHSVDFRRQLKARALEYGIPIQIIRESSLKPSDEFKFGERQLTPLSDRLWNISNALFYKSGGKPWKLGTIRENVCYIGISYKRADQGNTACCAAQMFLDSGDGVVFLGEYGPWYSHVNKQFHLSKSSAKELLQGTLRTYFELEGKELKEIFLHSHSGINSEEFEGFKEATPNGVKLTAIRIRKEYSSGRRLYREGKYPVLRGTVIQKNDHSCLLWANGFKPRIAAYDGWETPLPLLVDIQHGEHEILQVAKDILSLTKLNYNACHLSDSMPITIGYSASVGEILVNSSPNTQARPNFKFYI